MSEDNEHVFRDQEKKGKTKYCNGKYRSYECRWTITIKDEDWTCWYEDTSFGLDTNVHGGVFYAGEVKYTRYRGCRTNHFWGDAQKKCEQYEGVREDHYDDDICNNEANNWPKHDVREMQAWRLGETLRKLQMETFSHMYDQSFSLSWLYPYSHMPDWFFHQIVEPTRFQWTFDVMHNM